VPVAAEEKLLTRRPLGLAHWSCPICESRDLRYEFIADSFPVCSCARCNLKFLNPQPDCSGDADGGAEPLAESPYELHLANARWRLDQLQRYAGELSGPILLVSPDHFLEKEAERRNLTAVTASQRDVETGHFPGSGTGKFTACILHGFLECTPDPLAALSALRTSLHPNAVLMVISPTLDSRTARLFRSSWW